MTARQLPMTARGLSKSDLIQHTIKCAWHYRTKTYKSVAARHTVMENLTAMWQQCTGVMFQAMKVNSNQGLHELCRDIINDLSNMQVEAAA
jgi:hypothetical protein